MSEVEQIAGELCDLENWLDDMGDFADGFGIANQYEDLSQ